ncbi:hypothetical protein [Aliarcobacter cryaerophilus]|uniref:hypothetical protein n=1 Tax=Aliarcobacter cryaerophilus TaxID=28198 RepID=UPI0021B48995|nr:hypothetical protein [Aliarcobacter cryaerophilus]MCT7510956.1 hypothetical protein [Aliarcobacter cryaerophilus]
MYKVAFYKKDKNYIMEVFNKNGNSVCCKFIVSFDLSEVFNYVKSYFNARFDFYDIAFEKDDIVIISGGIKQ